MHAQGGISSVESDALCRQDGCCPDLQTAAGIVHKCVGESSLAIPVCSDRDNKNSADCAFATDSVHIAPGGTGPKTGLVLTWLAWLDARIRQALAAGSRVYGPESVGDAYRGLYITPADVDRLLLQPPGQPLFGGLGHLAFPQVSELPGPFRRLVDQCGLDGFDIAILLLSLAPEFDLRYERLYAYLHDDVTRKRPTVDLALNLLCSDSADKLAMRARFLLPAPLVRHGLLQLVSEGGPGAVPLLAKALRPDPQVAAALLGGDGLDERLADFCELLEPAAAMDSGTPLAEAQCQLLQHHAAVDGPLRLHLRGPGHSGQGHAVAQLAQARDKRILRADLRPGTASATVTLGKEHMHVLAREAWLLRAVLHVVLPPEGDQAASPRVDLLDALWPALRALPVDVVLEGPQPWVPSADKPAGVVTLSFAYPTSAERQHYWQYCLEDQGITLDEADLLQLACNYRLSYAQIRDASAVAARTPTPPTDPPRSAAANATTSTHPAAACLAAARAQSGHELAALATRIEPRATWDDLILPEDQTAQLQALCDRFRYRDKVLSEWGFAARLAYGLGISALFAGGSGTGKTMAAGVIANAMGLDLYKIDLSRVVSKYIGETEKNLDKVFTAAANANAILFFDEADALFGKRSEVKDAHDRYANLEICYLLQKMEQHEGIAILATNLRQNLDEAFMRRLTFIVHFPFPDEFSRKRIWSGVWPAATPLAYNINVDVLARQFNLSGGDIKNVSLAASFLAASEGVEVNARHVMHAISREYQKLGKSIVISPLAEVGHTA